MKRQSLRRQQSTGKDYSGKSANKLARSVQQWFDDPHIPGRQFGLVTEPALCYVRPVTRIAVRSRQRNGKWKAVVLISALGAQDVLALTGEPPSALSDQARVLLAYITFYDQRGGGVETSFKGDHQGLGSTKRSKKRFEAQQMVTLLGCLAHNVVIWARQWLTQAAASTKLRHYGILRMVRDVFHVSGFLVFDALGHIVQIVLNRAAPLAPILVDSLRVLLAPTHVAVNSGET